MPTEWSLAQSYGVSRSTAREALRRVQRQGLITRRRGAASRVADTPQSHRYSVVLGSAGDILRYTGTTVVQLSPHEEPVADAELTALGLLGDQPWYLASGVRWADPTAPPIAALSVLVPGRYAAAIAELRGPVTGAVFNRITAEHGLTLAGIEQTITASILNDSAASALDAEPGSPALEIVRRFFAEDVGIFEVSVSLHPAERFAYSVRFERESATG